MNKFDNQISRMKAMMNYGLQTESKNQYSAVEYNRVGADGKMYGIVREGTKYYIKVSDKTTNVLKENFDYIGGFRNRKNHEYSSYANALKNFEMKMQSVNEAVGKKDSIIIESWNPDRKEMLTVEATDKMRKEIARQRQIMGNATLIQEKKNYTVNLQENDCCGGKECKVDKECASTQKNNIAKKSDGKGEPTGMGGDPFTEKTNKKTSTSQKDNCKKECKPVMESEDVLAWNEDEDYLDTTHGTEIGDDAPFDVAVDCEEENDTVEEGAVMHNAKTQENPEVGVGEVGDGEPFEKEICEDVENDFEDETEDVEEIEGEEDADFDEDFEDETEDVEEIEDEEEAEFDDDLEEVEDESDDEDVFESRLLAIETLLNKIADKVGVSTFDDDELYDDEEVDGEFEVELDDNDDDALDNDNEEETDDEDIEVFESKNFRKAMLKEDEYHYFGQHPAYQKEPMELPDAHHQEKDGYYDMNDESVENEEEYGKEIGDTAPFEVEPKHIENAIAESLKNILKKKI